MTFPFETLATSSRELGLVVAVVIGIAFGFVLERAGFGRADKLAAQFYFRDLTVFKVMFTAIVTAMLGLVVASSFGFADLRGISESIVSWTYVWPMLAGGLLLGVGFIVSGYCPGTSAVAAASGNIDGVFAFGGVVAGTFVYSELLQIPRFQQFHESGDKGAWFLYDLVKVPPQILAVVIAAVALLAFVGGEKVERIVAGEQVMVRSRQRRHAFVTVMLLAAVAALGMAVRPSRPTTEAGATKTIAASELARLIVAEPWKLRIADVRDEAAFASGRVPGSELVKAEALGDVAAAAAAAQQKLVVVGSAKTLPARAEVLAGGFESWKAYALTPPPPAAGAPQRENDEYLFRVALNQSLTGVKQAAAPIPARTGVIAKPKKKGGGCSA